MDQVGLHRPNLDFKIWPKKNSVNLRGHLQPVISTYAPRKWVIRRYCNLTSSLISMTLVSRVVGCTDDSYKLVCSTTLDAQNPINFIDTYDINLPIEVGPTTPTSKVVGPLTWTCLNFSIFTSF